MAVEQPSNDESNACVGLTAFQTDMLAVLADGSRHGLGVKSEMELRYKTINNGRLYPNLDTLVEMGFVEKSELDKRTNEYALTDQGRRELEDYRRWIAAFLDCAVNEEIVTDGGVDVGSSEHSQQRDPEDDPLVCSICGQPLSNREFATGRENCDSCVHEYVGTGVEQ